MKICMFIFFDPGGAYDIVQGSSTSVVDFCKTNCPILILFHPSDVMFAQEVTKPLVTLLQVTSSNSIDINLSPSSSLSPSSLLIICMGSFILIDSEVIVEVAHRVRAHLT